MNIPLSVANRPTKPGLYVMQEHDWEAPRMVRASFMHVAGDDKPTTDLSIEDSRSHHHGHAPLNEMKADGGKWQSFISPDARFSTEVTFSDTGEKELPATPASEGGYAAQRMLRQFAPESI